MCIGVIVVLLLAGYYDGVLHIATNCMFRIFILPIIGATLICLLQYEGIEFSTLMARIKSWWCQNFLQLIN